MYSYNDINIDRIKFGRPYKREREFFIEDQVIKKSVYYIDVEYENGPLYIEIKKSEIKDLYINYRGDITCLLRGHSFYRKFIEPLEKFIIQSVYENSNKWFGGKSFSHEKISKCIVSNIKPQGKDYVLSLTKKSKLIETINRDNFTSIKINLRELQFIDNRFTYNFILECQLNVGEKSESNLESNLESESESEFEDEYYKDM